MNLKELKLKIMNEMIKLRNEGLVEQDCVMDVLEDTIDPFVEERERQEKCGDAHLQRIAELEAQIEQLQKINNEQKETLKKVRVALIQERTANIMNYGKGGAEMFDSMFEVLKGVSN